MPKSLTRSLLSAGAALLFFAALAMAEKGKSIDVYTDAVLPDGQQLKAVKYQVVVSEGEKEVQFLQDDRVVAKHACQNVAHEEGKNRYNQARYTATPDKKQKLTELRLAGKSYILNLDVKQGM